MGQNKFDRCLICDSPRLRELQRYRENFLVKCDNCSFIFCSRLPTDEELVEHYEGYGREDYLSPITVKRYRELLEKFESYRKNNQLLDVGCGIGYFLDVAKEEGWETYGTEFTEKAIKICKDKGHQMHMGKLHPKEFNSKFDVITSFEVIEHINNPVDEVNKIYSLLRPGGILYLTTPNFGSLSRRYLKEKSTIIHYPEHLSYYTPKTMRLLLRNAGFKNIRIRTTGISITRIRKGMGKSDQEFISKDSDDEKLRHKFEKNRFMGFIKRFANWIISILNIGLTIKVTAVKPEQD